MDASAGNVCRYVCTNYDTCSGDVELTCTEDGTWTGGNLPSCESNGELLIMMNIITLLLFSEPFSTEMTSSFFLFSPDQ